MPLSLDSATDVDVRADRARGVGAWPGLAGAVGAGRDPGAGHTDCGWIGTHTPCPIRSTALSPQHWAPTLASRVGSGVAERRDPQSELESHSQARPSPSPSPRLPVWCANHS